MLRMPFSILDQYRDSSKNLICSISDAGEIQVLESLPGMQTVFSGINNTIVIYTKDNELPVFQNCKAMLRNNDKLFIGYSKFPIRALIVSSRSNGNSVSIGENFSCSAANIELKGGKSVFIGNDCMFSKGINIYSSDMHSIFDSSGKLINKDDNISIADHVWVGLNVTLLKGANIPDGTVIGAGSIVSKKKYPPRAVIAGNPAIVIKEDITWNRKSPDQFI